MEDLFLDSNAHQPLSQNARRASKEFHNSLASHGHPLSPSTIGRAACKAAEDARGKIAKLIGAKSSNQIIFTNSCTQACQWAIDILQRQHKQIISSPIEHPAVERALPKGAPLNRKLPVSPNGMVEFTLQASKTPFGVACIHVQNEIGTIQNIKSIKEIYGDHNTVFSDMSQSLGKTPVNVTDLNIDIATFGAHKFGGPGGVGFMYLKDNTIWSEFGTGSRYFMDIPGTPNVAGMVATAAALEEAVLSLNERRKNMHKFGIRLEIGLIGLGFDIIGAGAPRCPNVTFAKAPINAFDLMLKLGDKGIHCGLGSACGSLYAGGSPIMAALGVPSDGQEYIRISQWGKYSTAEADRVLTEVEKILNRKYRK